MREVPTTDPGVMTTSKEQKRSWYEVLDVPPNATAQDIEDAYERAIALIEGRAVGGYLMLDPVAIQAAREDVETAYLVLSDEVERARFDAEQGHDSAEGEPEAGDEYAEPQVDDDTVSAGAADTLITPAPAEELAADPADVDKPPAPAPDKVDRYASGLPRRALKILAPTLPPMPAADAPSTPPERKSMLPIQAPVEDTVDDVPPTKVQSDPAPEAKPKAEAKREPPPSSREVGEVHVFLRRNVDDDISDMVKAENEINGSVLRRVREARGVSIEELSEQTKVSKSVLRAIEGHDFDALPARVYLRGFLTQVARVLRVDKKRVADGYLTFVERHGQK